MKIKITKTSYIKLYIISLFSARNIPLKIVFFSVRGIYSRGDGKNVDNKHFIEIVCDKIRQEKITIKVSHFTISVSVTQLE